MVDRQQHSGSFQPRPDSYWFTIPYIRGRCDFCLRGPGLRGLVFLDEIK